jgi:GcrA cell cycle regulator
MWTKERDETLKTLWGTGLSTARIAAEIGGITKNAVIGRARRMSLPARRPGGTPSTKCTRRVRTAMAAQQAASIKPLTFLGGSRMGPPAVKVEPITAPVLCFQWYDDRRREAGLVHLLDLEPHHCRFAIGYDHKLGHGFCGCNAAPGLPYCEHHAARVYTPLERVWPIQRGEPRLTVATETTAARVQEFLEPA